MADNETNVLMSLLRTEYERLDGGGEIEISPALLAAKTFLAIDPAAASPGLVRLAATLELRQLARSICRQRIEEDEARVERQGEMFVQLQGRYPCRRGGDEVYVRREYMTLDERRAFESRLRQESVAKMRHADALAAETDALIAAGVFSLAA